MKANNTNKEFKRSADSIEEDVVVNSMEKASVFSLKLLVPVAVLFVGPYCMIWELNPLRELNLNASINLLIYILPGIVVHELLHALVFTLFAPSGFRAIRFGIKWEYLSPYCHCKEAVKIWQYCMSAAMPLLILGILPAVYAIITANAFLLFYGVFFIWAAGGDMLSLWLLRKYNPHSMVRDHPQELGFIVYSNHESGRS